MVPLLLITIPFSISVVNAGSWESTGARICRRNAGRLSAEPFHEIFVGLSLSVADVPTIQCAVFKLVQRVPLAVWIAFDLFEVYPESFPRCNYVEARVREHSGVRVVRQPLLGQC